MLAIELVTSPMWTSHIQMQLYSIFQDVVSSANENSVCFFSPLILSSSFLLIMKMQYFTSLRMRYQHWLFVQQYPQPLCRLVTEGLYHIGAGFFQVLPRGLEKAAIYRISLILPFVVILSM